MNEETVIDNTITTKQSFLSLLSLIRVYNDQTKNDNYECVENPSNYVAQVAFLVFWLKWISPNGQAILVKTSRLLFLIVQAGPLFNFKWNQLLLKSKIYN